MEPLRVALVDDYGPVRELLAELLEGPCEIVGQAADGHQALALLPRVECDLVVMDFHMPVMDGLEATRAIAARYPALTVVAFTSANDADTVSALLAAGATKHSTRATSTA